MENGKRQIDEYIGKAFACTHQDLGVRTGKIKCLQSSETIFVDGSIIEVI